MTKQTKEKKLQTFTCSRCSFTFTPSFWKWFWAPKVFDVWRYLKCPNCKTKIWMKRKKKQEG